MTQAHLFYSGFASGPHLQTKGEVSSACKYSFEQHALFGSARPELNEMMQQIFGRK